MPEQHGKSSGILPLCRMRKVRARANQAGNGNAQVHRKHLKAQSRDEVSPPRPAKLVEVGVLRASDVEALADTCRSAAADVDAELSAPGFATTPLLAILGIRGSRLPTAPKNTWQCWVGCTLLRFAPKAQKTRPHPVS